MTGTLTIPTDGEGKRVDEILPPSWAINCASLMRDLDTIDESEVIPRTDSPEDIPPHVLATQTDLRASQRLLKRISATSEATLAEAMVAVNEMGPAARRYAMEIMGAATYWYEQESSNLEDLRLRRTEIETFKDEYTNGYALGTFGALLLSPVFLILKALGLFIILNWIGLSIGVETRKESTLDPVIQIMIWETVTALAAVMMAIASRTFLMRHRLKKLPKITQRMHAEARFHYYDGRMSTLKEVIIRTGAALRRLIPGDQVTLPLDFQNLVRHLLSTNDRQRLMSAAEAGMKNTSAESLLTELGMTGEEDTFVEGMMDLFT